MRFIKFLLVILSLWLFVVTFGQIFKVNAQSVEDLQKQIQDYQNQINTLSAQSQTLSNQIAQFDTKIKLTTLKIQATQEQISLLGGRIGELETSLNGLSDAFSSRVIESYKMARLSDQFFFLVSSGSIDEVVSRYHYLKQIEASDQNLLQRLQKAQNIYQDQKASQEDLQKELQTEEADLNKQKLAKANLLSVTQNNEKKYQQLLAQAQAQLAALSNFSSTIGASILPHQDLSDSWGKYFNQRDANWGNTLINNDSHGCNGPCSMASVGCLVTSYSMVVTHFGGSVTPGDVAINPDNFYLATALFNSPGPSANGHSPSSLDHPSNQQITDALNSNAAVIIGLSKDGGPWADHWVVVRSSDGGSFKINDPFYQGAMNVSINDHYANWKIVSARIYR